MKTVSLRDAQQNLSDLVAEVEGGEEVAIARDGRPVAKLVAVPRTQIRERVPGDWAHLFPNGVPDHVYRQHTDAELREMGWEID